MSISTNISPKPASSSSTILSRASTNPRIREITAYLAVSAAAMAFDVGLFATLIAATALGATLAGSISYLVALVFHYGLAIRFVFDPLRTGKSHKRLISEYIATGLVGVTITAAVIYLFTQHFGAWALAAKGCGILASFFAVYALRSFLVFKPSAAAAQDIEALQEAEQDAEAAFANYEKVRQELAASKITTDQSQQAARSGGTGVDVTIVMPCLDEILSIRHCIENAKEALRRIHADYGLNGEIVIADNGSTDGSQALATELGARVVPVTNRGYGAALIGGGHAAYGRFILMGDCDGSYDFTNGVAMIGKLTEGYALCMGSRFDGGIEKGAMPWKNRWIGNPVLTGILNLFFRTGINDAHCGLRAITKHAFLDLNLSGSGMEFASEMVIKASLKKLPMTQVPATLSKDLRDREPHLRPWRDGWRHLRYLLMLSPTWAFGVPALASLSIGLGILLVALLNQAGLIEAAIFGATWTILAGTMVIVGHMAGVIAVATHLYGVQAGYRLPHRWLWRYRSLLSLEGMLISGMALLLTGITAMVVAVAYWSASSFAALPSVLPVVIACCCGAMGMQNIFGGLMLAILGGHEAQFMKPLSQEQEPQADLRQPLSA